MGRRFVLLDRVCQCRQLAPGEIGASGARSVAARGARRQPVRIVRQLLVESLLLAVIAGAWVSCCR